MIGRMPQAPRPSLARKPRSAAQRKTILDAASLLFIEKGFGGTNINDIADAIGVTRTAVYYYFPSKEAMLEALTKDVTEHASEIAAEVAQSSELPPDEVLHELILRHAELVLQRPLQFRVAERSESSLPATQRQAAQAARRAVRDRFVEVIRRGVDQGVFHPVDPAVAAFSIIGMCNWCAWWFDERRAEPIAPIAQQIAAFGMRMLEPVVPTGAGSQKKKRLSQPPQNDLSFALAHLRQALQILEQRSADPA